MNDGVLIDGGGTIVSVVRGRSDAAVVLQGQTFVALTTVDGLERGMVAPNPATQILAATDYEMSRGVEDLVALLINKGTFQATELPAPLRKKINARRILRNEGTI